SCWMIDDKLVRLIGALGERSKANVAVPTLGFTHYQAAQPLTVGRRLAQYAYELWLCRENLTDSNLRYWYRLRGLRGATGTQASFLALAGGDSRLVDILEYEFRLRFPHRLDIVD